MVTCGDVCKYLDDLAQPSLAEEWDNVGLLVGGACDEVRKIMVCLDVTTKVVEEAIQKGVNLLISHHPVIFKPLKRIRKEDFKGKILYALIKNEIAVYSAHTNLDVAKGGLNDYLAELIGLKDIQNLNAFKNDKLYKIVVFVPEEFAEDVRGAMCNEGAGWIGNYSDCTFSVLGTGTFKPLEGTEPFIGSKYNLETVREIRLETIAPERSINKIIDAMKKRHPYEEVAYDVYPLKVKGQEYGLGKVGVVQPACPTEQFISKLKEVLNTEYIRVIGDLPEKIVKAAVFCGGFDGDCSGLFREKPDLLITGDIKHNLAVDLLEMGFCIIDAGHFATEVIVKDLLVKILKDKFREVDIIKSEWEKNPLNIT